MKLVAQPEVAQEAAAASSTQLEAPKLKEVAAQEQPSSGQILEQGPLKQKLGQAPT